MLSTNGLCWLLNDNKLNDIGVIFKLSFLHMTYDFNLRTCRDLWFALAVAFDYQKTTTKDSYRKKTGMIFLALFVLLYL